MWQTKGAETYLKQFHSHNCSGKKIIRATKPIVPYLQSWYSQPHSLLLLSRRKEMSGYFLLYCFQNVSHHLLIEERWSLIFLHTLNQLYGEYEKKVVVLLEFTSSVAQLYQYLIFLCFPGFLKYERTIILPLFYISCVEVKWFYFD